MKTSNTPHLDKIKSTLLTVREEMELQFDIDEYTLLFIASDDSEDFYASILKFFEANEYALNRWIKNDLKVFAEAVYNEYKK